MSEQTQVIPSQVAETGTQAAVETPHKNGVSLSPTFADVLLTPDFLADIVELNGLLKQQDSEEYWQACCNLLHKYSQAEAASIFLFRSHASRPQLIAGAGDFNEGSLARVRRWEDALLSTTGEEFRSLEDGDIELGVGRRDGDLPIIHMRLRIGGFLLGGASLVFSAQSLPQRENYAALARFVHLLTDNGLRARQLGMTRHRLDQVSLIAQVSQSLNSTLDLRVVLHETTEMTAYVLQAQAATLFLTEERMSELVFYLPTGEAGGLLKERRIPMNQGVAGWVATNRESIIVNDTNRDHRFTSQVDAETGFQTKNILCVPLLAQGRLVGVLEVLNKESDGGFNEEDMNWLETMANQAAIAIENARLYENLRREQERIIKAQEEVRHTIARDLHDGAAQMLSLIIMNVDVSRQLLSRERYDTVRSELDLLEDLAKQANRDIRTLLFELRPIILESRGLISALYSYHEQLQKTVNAEIHLEVEEPTFELKPNASSNIFSVVQESINNIRKHAQAQNIWIRVALDEDTFSFSVEDDGVGFNVRSTQSDYDTRGSFGLLNMHERVEMLGGKLSIESPRSQAKGGTLIYGTIPIAQIRHNPLD